jgi:hypothetical protein
MQPFDRSVFDKRYDDVFEPAIQDAGLEPYRVDRDPSVSIPIDEIESGIRRSEICLAEITTNNPNVWFELGFAIAVPKEVVLICSDERKEKFPFDVQHRSIIKYKTESPQDFQKLRKDISKRIKAVLKKQEEIGKASRISPVQETKGLTQHEIVALVTVMQNSFISLEGVSAYTIKEDMNKAGFTDIAVSLALKSLGHKAMINSKTEQDYNGNSYAVYYVTSDGEQWLLDNQNKLVLREEPPPTSQSSDDIPF